MDKPNDRRKEISDFAKKLGELVAAAPDDYARRDLRRMVHALRQRYVLSPEEKQVRIMELLEDGLTTYDELLDATKFGSKQLSRHLSELQSQAKIRAEKIRRTSGAGRPQLCYFLA